MAPAGSDFPTGSAKSPERCWVCDRSGSEFLVGTRNGGHQNRRGFVCPPLFDHFSGGVPTIQIQLAIFQADGKLWGAGQEFSLRCPQALGALRPRSRAPQVVFFSSFSFSIYIYIHNRKVGSFHLMGFKHSSRSWTAGLIVLVSFLPGQAILGMPVFDPRPRPIAGREGATMSHLL